MAKNNYLFVYGTLLQEGNQFAGYLKTHCTLHAEGRMKGLLFDVGDYPAAVYLPGGDDFVYGSIFSIDDTSSILNVLDDYEGFGEDYPQPNEFIRELVEIETGTGALNCWGYLYNWDVAGLRRITSGKYTA